MMFHIAGEGERLKNGFNFYPKSEWNSSRGVNIKFGNRRITLRYSVLRKKLFISYAKFDPMEYADFMAGYTKG